MSFGQQSGPPASQKQMEYLRSLLQAAGHDDFRTARHEFGLTQRQASGKFSTREASALIDRLTGEEPSAEAVADAAAASPKRASPASDAAMADSRADLLRGFPAELLANELERRGWAVISPT